MQKIIYSRQKLDVSNKRMKGDEKTKMMVKTKTYDKSIQTSKAPEFNHPEIRQLYESGMRIDHQIIKEILGLPRTGLIEDLETILKDVVRRYEYFKEKVDEDGWVEEEQTFLIHALFLLAELNATESLDKVLPLLRQDEKLLEFWFGDYLNEEVWRTVYQLGKSQLATLKQFILEPHLYVYARSAICTSVVQIAYHEPERKPEVVGWIKDVLTSLLNNKDDNGLIDSDFIGFTIGDIINLKAKELLPLVKTFFDHGLVSKSICGDFKNVEYDTLNRPEKDYYKYNLYNIYDRYTHILTTWAGYKKEEEKGKQTDRDLNNYEFTDDFQQEELFSPEAKIGRNNPCPCGSGKKYKKCCGTK